MTRNQQQPEVVRLSPGNWIALLGTLVVIAGLMLSGAWNVSETMSDVREELSGLRSDVKSSNNRMDGVERRLERVEESVIFNRKAHE